MSHWANVLGCQIGEGDLNYLGTTIGVSTRSIKFWDPLLSKVKNKLVSWKCDNVSMAGKLVLLRSSVDSLPLYWLNLHKLPSTVTSKLEAFWRQFFWGSRLVEGNRKDKMHLLKWDNIFSPKEMGGLGVMSIKHKNLSMLAKWWWR